MPYTHTEILNFLGDANWYALSKWPTASNRYQRSGNSPAWRRAWFSPLAAILKKSSKVCAPLGKVCDPPGYFSQQDCWFFPPSGNFGGKPPPFHLDTSPVTSMPFSHCSHQPHDAGLRWVYYHPCHTARPGLLHW